MEVSAADGQALNVGSGQRLTVNEVARVLLKLYGSAFSAFADNQDATYLSFVM